MAGNFAGGTKARQNPQHLGLMGESGDYWIETYTGLCADLVDLKPEQISMNDISFSLASQNRFTGHCKRFYSIAEHSLIMASAIHSAEGRSDLALIALLDDADEAFTGDINRPLKLLLRKLCPEFTLLLAKIKDAVYRKFRINVHTLDFDKVKHYDMLALLAEAKCLMPSQGATWNLPKWTELNTWQQAIVNNMIHHIESGTFRCRQKRQAGIFIEFFTMFSAYQNNA